MSESANEPEKEPSKIGEAFLAAREYRKRKAENQVENELKPFDFPDDKQLNIDPEVRRALEKLEDYEKIKQLFEDLHKENKDLRKEFGIKEPSPVPRFIKEYRFDPTHPALLHPSGAKISTLQKMMTDRFHIFYEIRSQYEVQIAELEHENAKLKRKRYGFHKPISSYYHPQNRFDFL